MTSAGDASADEVRALLTSLTEWAKRAVPAPPSGHGGPECQWCPLCQLASALRGEHPELTERMAEAGAAVSGAVRALLDPASRGAPVGRDGVGTPAAEAPAPPESEPGDRPRRRPRPRIERVELDDSPGTD